MLLSVFNAKYRKVIKKYEVSDEQLAIWCFSTNGFASISKKTVRIFDILVCVLSTAFLLKLPKDLFLHITHCFIISLT